MLGRLRWLAAAALLACSPEYQLLRTSPATGGGGAASGGVGSGAEAGLPGLPGGALGGFGGNEAEPIGGESSAGAETGAPEGGAETGGVGGGASSAGTCASHLDCGATTVCSASRCVTCPEVPSACAGPCEHGFAPVLFERNGCSICECRPPSECTSDTDCPTGERCYPGAQCEPGCAEPSCCSGNHCSAVGCAGAPIPHCLIAGCAGGAVCLAGCDAVTCECDGTAWKCAESSGAGGALGASCPQACASP